MEKMASGKNLDKARECSERLITTLTAKYMSIAKVNLNSGEAIILKSDKDSEIIGMGLVWEDVVEQYVRVRIHPQDQELLKNLHLERLIAYYEQAAPILPIEVRCLREENMYDWIRISADVVLDEDRQILVMTQLINEEVIIKKIMELYVYPNFDYFVLLNTKKNSYTTFRNRPGTPLPPEKGDDYEAEVERYNDKYVVEEEKDAVTERMMISHVQYMLESQEVYSFTTGAVTDEGKYRHTQISFTYFDKPGGLILLTRMDITRMYLDEQKREQQLASALQEAKHDPMTELYNKRAMYEMVSALLDKQYRMQAAVMFIDIDNFKLVNDTLGHQKGDELLCYLSRALTKLVGGNGMAGRIGGDEFLLFIPVVYDMEQISKCAENICHTLQEEKNVAFNDLPVSCSVGISIYPRDGVSYENLLYKADQALYNAKRYGKCQYAFYSLEMDG